MSVENLTGRSLGQYHLQELLGVGGMGAVYRAHQSALGRDVAVKVLPGELAQERGYIDRFKREAHIAASLEHPHIVPIYDYGTQDGIAYVVMRLLNDGTLAQRLYVRRMRGETLPALSETADLLRILAGALDYAHRKGVVHRDIKPGNIMFDDGTPYIVDFGIARLLNEAALTGQQQVFGTPMYMPPEQWRDEELTPETDQYALASVLYTMITGQPLFPTAQPQQLVFHHLNDTPVPPTTVRPDLPPAVSDVLARALAKRPGERFLTVTTFAQAFGAAVAGKETATTGFFTFPLTDDLPVESDSVNVSQRVPQAPEAESPPPAPIPAPNAPPLSTIKSVPRVEEPLPAVPRAQPVTPSVPPPPRPTPAYVPPPARPAPALQRSSTLRSLVIGCGVGLFLLALVVGAGLLLAGNQLLNFLQSEAQVTTATATVQPGVSEPTTLPDTQATPITPVAADPVQVTPGRLPDQLPAPEDVVMSQAAVLTHSSGTVRALDFSPRGGTLATGGGDTFVHLWDTTSNTQMGTFSTGGVINDVRYNRDGSRIAASSEAGTVTLYDVDGGAVIATWSAHSVPVRGVAFSPDGSRLVTTSEDQTALVWDVAAQAQVLRLTGHNGHVLDADYSPDGSLIVTGGRDGTVRLWDAASGSQLQVMNGHTDEVRSVSFSPDGSLIASGSADGTIRLWDAASGAALTTLGAASNWIWSVEFSPDGSLLAAGDRNNTATVWDATSGTLIATLTGHTGWVIAVDFSPDGALLATGSGDGTARLWSTSSG